jgi:hypothetical protein
MSAVLLCEAATELCRAEQHSRQHHRHLTSTTAPPPPVTGWLLGRMYEADLAATFSSLGLDQPQDMEQASQAAAATLMLCLAALRYSSHAQRARTARTRSAAAAASRAAQLAAAGPAKRRVTVDMLAPPVPGRPRPVEVAQPSDEEELEAQRELQERERVQRVVPPEVYAVLGVRYLAAQGLLYGVYVATGNMAASLVAGVAMQVVHSLFGEVREDLNR